MYVFEYRVLYGELKHTILVGNPVMISVLLLSQEVFDE